MNDKVFLDSNIWIYAATGRFSAAQKCEIACDLIAKTKLAVSPQVIGEFYINTRNGQKMKQPLSDQDALGWIARMQLFPFVETDKDIVNQALLTAQRWQTRYWDAAMIASAARYGATTLYTEDLNHGQLYGTVRALNPFRPA